MYFVLLVIPFIVSSHSVHTKKLRAKLRVESFQHTNNPSCKPYIYSTKQVNMHMVLHLIIFSLE